MAASILSTRAIASSVVKVMVSVPGQRKLQGRRKHGKHMVRCHRSQIVILATTWLGPTRDAVAAGPTSARTCVEWALADLAADSRYQEITRSSRRASQQGTPLCK